MSEDEEILDEEFEKKEEFYEDVDYSDAAPKIVGGIDDYIYTLKIPKERVAVLIGVKGKEKRELESYGGAKIVIDSKEGDVSISGKDALKLFELREVIKAIGRGFNPDVAKLLMKPDYVLEIINLKDYGIDNPNKMMRVRARLIGTGGKARRTLEELTRAYIIVYGKTISLIGECDSVGLAKKAVEMIVTGSMHTTVYKWLEGQRRKRREEEKGF